VNTAVQISEQRSAGKNPRAGERKLSPAAVAIVRVYDRLIDVLGFFAAASLLALPLIITFDVALRATRIGNIKWIVDVSEYFLFLSTFLGAPWLMRLGLHVRVDVLLTALNKKAARKLEAALDLFCVLICGVLAYYGLLAAIDAYRLDLKQYKALTVPDWPFHAIFVFTMVLLAIEFIRRMRRPDEALVHDPTIGM
jgi:TRAP-type C4-dicarboxylate transport system permease small subunit